MIVVAVGERVIVRLCRPAALLSRRPPSGPAIILVAGLIYLLSVALGPFGGLFWLVWPRRHLEA